MNNVYKITLVTVSTLVVLGLLGYGVWFFFLKSPAGTTDQSKSFSFFGFNKDTSEPIGGDTTPTNKQDKTQTQGGIENQKLPALRMIHKGPIVGAQALEKEVLVDVDLNKSEKHTFARYINRIDGHVYDTDVNTMETVRISNTTIPKIYEAFWADNAENLIIRYLDEENSAIKTFAAEINYDADIKEGDTSGSFLPDDIENISISGNSKNIFYLKKSTPGIEGVITNFSTNNKKQVFRSSFTEWLSQIADGDIFLTTKASYASNGFLYELKNNTLEKVLGGIPGFTTLVSSDANTILYSQSVRNSLTLSAYDRKKGFGVLVPLKTLPEKCVWSQDNITIYCAASLTIPSANYPDDWYKGRVSFADSIWIYNTETSNLSSIAIPREYSIDEMDIIKPFLDAEERYLFFTNKKNLSLWVIELPRE